MGLFIFPVQSDSKVNYSRDFGILRILLLDYLYFPFSRIANPTERKLSIFVKYGLNKIPILLCILPFLFYLCIWFVCLSEDCTTIFEGKISVCCLLTFRSLAAEESHK